jgi:hypothetical protein
MTGKKRCEEVMELLLATAGLLMLPEEQIKAIAATGQATETEARSLVEKLPLNSTQLLEYGVCPLSQKVSQIDLQSTRKDIKEFNHRLEAGIDRNIDDITINGRSGYSIEFIGSIEYGDPDKNLSDSSPYIPALEIYRDNIPAETLLQGITGLLLHDGTSCPVLPIGLLEYNGKKNDEDAEFFVVWEVKSQKYWVILDPKLKLGPDTYATPYERQARFPGTQDYMSVAVLSGPLLEEGTRLELEIVADKGFGYHRVVGLNGTMELVYGAP